MRSPVTNEPPAYRSLFTHPTIRLLARAVKGVALRRISGEYQQHGPRWASGTYRSDVAFGNALLWSQPSSDPDRRSRPGPRQGGRHGQDAPRRGLPDLV